MRTLLRVVVGIVALVVIAVVVVAFSLDRIVKSAVQDEATKSLALKTTLDRAHVSLTGGKVDLRGLKIASPAGFSAPSMLEVGGIAVAIRYDQLRADPKQIESLTIDAPKLIIEQSHGVLNFRKAEQMMPKSEPSKKPMKLVIDTLEVRNADVVIEPGLPGLSRQINVRVPSLTLKNVGRSGNGAAIHDVAMQVISALAERAAQSGGVPAELKGLLHLNVAATAASMRNEAVKRVGEAVPGQLQKDLLNRFGNPGGAQPSGRAPSPPPRGQ
jgi:hypothetical protein